MRNYTVHARRPDNYLRLCGAPATEWARPIIEPADLAEVTCADCQDVVADLDLLLACPVTAP